MFRGFARKSFHTHSNFLSPAYFRQARHGHILDRSSNKERGLVPVTPAGPVARNGLWSGRWKEKWNNMLEVGRSRLALPAPNRPPVIPPDWGQLVERDRRSLAPGYGGAVKESNYRKSRMAPVNYRDAQHPWRPKEPPRLISRAGKVLKKYWNWKSSNHLGRSATVPVRARDRYGSKYDSLDWDPYHTNFTDLALWPRPRYVSQPVNATWADYLVV